MLLKEKNKKVFFLLKQSDSSDLRRQFADQVCVRTRVDLALEQLRRRGHGELGHFLAQRFARAIGLEVDLLLSRRDEPLAFLRGRGLRLLDQLVRAVLRVIDDLRRTLARFADDRVRVGARLRELRLALLGRSEPERDLLAALFHRVGDQRPHEFHREPDQHDEHDHLHEARQIEVHGRLLPGCGWRLLQPAPETAVTNGFANVKNSAKPIPIIATASTSAATMNIFVCSIGVSSGWRAAPSRKRPPKMPKPMAVPRAPRPKMIPTARTVMA